MKPNQSYTEWVADLRGVARNCVFQCSNESCKASFVDDLIRDAIVINTPHDVVRVSCLQKQNPSLEEVLETAKIYETTTKTCSTIKGESSCGEINKIVSNASRFRSRNREQSGSCSNFYRSCPDCIEEHDCRQCRFSKAICDRCRKKGHIASVCMSRSKDRSFSRRRSRFRSRGQSNGRRYGSRSNYNRDRHFSNHRYRSSSSPSPARDRNIAVTNSIDVNSPSVYSINDTRNKIWIGLKINCCSISFQIDTGALWLV